MTDWIDPVNTDAMNDIDARPASGGQDLVDELACSGKLDVLFDSIDSGSVALTGKGGFVPALIKAVLE